MTITAGPVYAVNDCVRYVDHHKREQIGVIFAITAYWAWRPDDVPLIAYVISHPTYRNERCSRAESHILGAAS
jgi:hypothetical protein